MKMYKLLDNAELKAFFNTAILVLIQLNIIKNKRLAT